MLVGIRLGIQCAFELAERCKTCGSDQATILDFVSSVAWIDIGKAVTVFKFTICKSLMKSLYALARRRHLQASTAITIATSYTKTMVGCAPVSKKLTKFIERTFKLHTTVVGLRASSCTNYYLAQCQQCHYYLAQWPNTNNAYVQ